MKREFNQIINTIRSFIELERYSGIKDMNICNSKYQNLIIQLNELKRAACECQNCSLFKLRTNLVFGEGNPRARLMFIGEAPGREEDIQGRPFVGRAGELLTRIIMAMGFSREEVYITNVVKCRPPNNRNPLPSEVISCSEFLLKQIKLIAPRVICALGKISASFLTKSQYPISSIRGKEFKFLNIIVIPTYHPAYLLRNPQDKRLVWQDMKKIKKILTKKDILN